MSKLHFVFGKRSIGFQRRVIEKAVYGMLPKTALGRQVLRGKLRVYAGPEHPHTGQQPKTLTLPKSEAK